MNLFESNFFNLAQWPQKEPFEFARTWNLCNKTRILIIIKFYNMLKLLIWKTQIYTEVQNNKKKILIEC